MEERIRRIRSKNNPNIQPSQDEILRDKLQAMQQNMNNNGGKHSYNKVNSENLNGVGGLQL